MSLVVIDFLSCGWPIVGTNFSESVQIFQKNAFWGEPILGGSKLNVTAPEAPEEPGNDSSWCPNIGLSINCHDI